MIERQIEITTKAGAMNTFIVHPERPRPPPDHHPLHGRAGHP